MSPLAAKLSGLEPRAQAQLAKTLAAQAPTGELIEVLLTLRPRGWTEHHILHALSERGQACFEPVAAALLADPLAPGATALGEVLVRLLDDDSLRDPRVVPTLIQALGTALDSGAGTRDIPSYILFLRDCTAICGPLPELAPLAGRLLEVAATEADPYPLSDLAEQWLAYGQRPE
jgi:hypothetical protein